MATLEYLRECAFDAGWHDAARKFISMEMKENIVNRDELMNKLEFHKCEYFKAIRNLPGKLPMDEMRELQEKGRASFLNS